MSQAPPPPSSPRDASEPDDSSSPDRPSVSGGGSEPPPTAPAGGEPPPAAPGGSEPPPVAPGGYGSAPSPPGGGYGSPPPSPPGGGYGAPPPPPGAQPGYGGYGGGQPGRASGQLSQQDERMWSMLGHLGGIVLAIIAPLIVMLVHGEKSPFVRRHAVEALNFQITLVVTIFVCSVLFFLIIPILLAFVAGIGGVILMIIAGLKANSGEEYRYPVNVRLVK